MELRLTSRHSGQLAFEEGDYDLARDCFEQGLKMRRKLYPVDLFPKGDPELVLSLGNVAGILQKMGKFADAQQLFAEALAMAQQTHAPGDLKGQAIVATLLNNLGVLHAAQGDRPASHRYYKEALEIRERVYSPDRFQAGHPDLAAGLTNMAFVFASREEFNEARKFFEKALAMRRRLYSPERYPLGHPDLAKNLEDLGFLSVSEGEYLEAMQRFEEAGLMRRKLLETFVLAVSEADSLQFISTFPAINDGLLTSSRQLQKENTERAYSAIWYSKGLVSRIAAIRRQRLSAVSDPEARELVGQYEQIRRRMARMTGALLGGAKAPPEELQTLKKLTQQKEQLERRLAAHIPSLRTALDADRSEPGELAQRLPDGALFLDLIRYVRFEKDRSLPGEKGEKRSSCYVAFIITRAGPTKRVELGPAEPIDAAVQSLVTSLAQERVHPSPKRSTTSPEQVLRQLVWTPIEKQFPGKITHVYISPDGALTQVSWCALPGRIPGSVLLEDFALANVPHGPYLLASLKASARDDDRRAGVLLAVGDIAYDSRPAAPTPEKIAERTRDAATGDGHARWARLPGAERELGKVTSLARDQRIFSVALVRGDAVERRVLQELFTARWAHFATHGYFAPLKGSSRTEGDLGTLPNPGATQRRIMTRNPLLLSGLVLAGANVPRPKSEWGVPEGDDGILTAEEIASVVMPKLDLAVLSACETGLGQVADGEGVFGLQRAFHTAGAKNVIASLWKVDDNATAALMGIYYEKLWQQKKPPIEALREAQLAIYRNRDLVDKLAGDRGQSFSKTVEIVDGGRRAEGGETAHPRLWAAWVLSGLGR